MSRGEGPASFEAVVYAHAVFRRSAEDPVAQSQFDQVRNRFERNYGEITTAYWADDELSAVAVTRGYAGIVARFRGIAVRPQLHSCTDWLRSNPRISDLRHRCLESAIRAEYLLDPIQSRIALQLLFSPLARSLALPTRTDASTADGLDRQVHALESDLRDADRYIERAAAKTATRRYLVGLLVALVVVAVAAVLVDIARSSTTTADRATAAVIAGALGAVISVLQRLSGRFGVPPADLGSRVLTGLGAVRVLVGAAFGVVVYVVLASEIIVILPHTASSHIIYVYAATAFLAGFAERTTVIRFGDYPVDVRSSQTLTESIPLAVEQSVRATLLGPVLANWNGYVSVQHPSSKDGSPAKLAPLDEAFLQVTFSPDGTGAEYEQPINISEGVDEATVTFDLRLESDVAGLRAEPRSVTVPSGGSAEEEMGFVVPQTPGAVGLWLRVSQRGRVVQMVPFAIEAESDGWERKPASLQP